MKSFLLSSAEQFRQEVQLGFDCLLDFILPFLALANFLHIFIKCQLAISGGGKMRNQMGCEIDKNTRYVKIRGK